MYLAPFIFFFILGSVKWFCHHLQIYSTFVRWCSFSYSFNLLLAIEWIRSTSYMVLQPWMYIVLPVNLRSVHQFYIVTHVSGFLMQAEIEKVKKRREERALEKAQREEEMVNWVPWYLNISLLNLLAERTRMYLISAFLKVNWHSDVIWFSKSICFCRQC